MDREDESSDFDYLSVFHASFKKGVARNARDSAIVETVLYICEKE